jgi:hypothetical protein
MLNKINIVKAIIICAIVVALHTIYVASTSMQSVLVAEGQDVSRIEALSYHVSYIDFWGGMFFHWLSEFAQSLVSCLLLLLWLKK